jgi:hypothetical protein
MSEKEQQNTLNEIILAEKQKEELGHSLKDFVTSYEENQNNETYINEKLFPDFKKKMEIIWKIVYAKKKKNSMIVQTITV